MWIGPSVLPLCAFFQVLFAEKLQYLDSQQNSSGFPCVRYSLCCENNAYFPLSRWIVLSLSPVSCCGWNTPRVEYHCPTDGVHLQFTKTKAQLERCPHNTKLLKLCSTWMKHGHWSCFGVWTPPPPHLLHRAPSSAVAQCYTVHKAHFSCLIAFFLSCHLCPYGWRIITGKLCVYCHTRLIYLCLIVLFSSRPLCPVVGGWHRKWNGPIIVWQMECIIHYIIHCVLYYINTELPESLWKYRTV